MNIGTKTQESEELPEAVVRQVWYEQTTASTLTKRFSQLLDESFLYDVSQLLSQQIPSGSMSNLSPLKQKDMLHIYRREYFTEIGQWKGLVIHYDGNVFNDIRNLSSIWTSDIA